MGILTLKDLPVKGKRVLMRVDFNVPLDPDGKITDDTRIRAAIPSIQYVLDQGGSLILMSHLGRPEGVVDDRYTLAPCAKRLSELLKKDVKLAPDCVGEETQKLAESLQPGQILMLENLRFHPGEEHPDKEPDFVESLAKLGNVYVNDAFGTAHRAHASTYWLPQKFPGNAATGFLMEKEISSFEKLLKKPRRPFYALIGGAKISSKCTMIESLLENADIVLVGGGMTYTFMKAQGISIGNSIHEDSFINKAGELIRKYASVGKLVLPLDIVVTDHPDGSGENRIVKYGEGVPEGFEGVDIGPDTIELYGKYLMRAKSVFWNGPFGKFETPQFSKGTMAIAEMIAQVNGVTVVGGGDSVSAILKAGVGDKISHLSTGGGASLELVEYGTLPGIQALSLSETAAKK